MPSFETAAAFPLTKSLLMREKTASFRTNGRFLFLSLLFTYHSALSLHRTPMPHGAVT
jgi:hypothetical protein